MTSGESWGITLFVGLGLLLALGLTLATLVRSLPARSLPVRCPITGHVMVVQYVTSESGQLADVATCSAFPGAQPITCGLPCVTGPFALVPERPPADRLDV